jgi:hypothetical protein
MKIDVTCPGCMTRFSVSEKFAGRQGPCPKCHKVISIPKSSEQVVVHAPEDSGPRDSKGRPILQPIAFEQTRVTPVRLALMIGGAVAVLLAAGLIRWLSPNPPSWLLALAAIGLAPPLALLGYAALRDQELEPYRGRELMIRLGICSVVLPLLWLLYSQLAPWVLSYRSVSQLSAIEMAISFAVVLAIGGAVSMLCFELEYGSGLLHSGLYLIVTFALAVLVGVPLGEMFYTAAVAGWWSAAGWL